MVPKPLLLPQDTLMMRMLQAGSLSSACAETFAFEHCLLDWTPPFTSQGPRLLESSAGSWLMTPHAS
jgi:hypothetical protein